MKKIINRPETLVKEMCNGIVAAHPEFEFIEKYKTADPFEYNTAGAIKNQLFQAYLSIYRSKEHLIQTPSALLEHYKERTPKGEYVLVFHPQGKGGL